MRHKWILSLLIILLPLISGCNSSDDVKSIFTGKTWKLTYITLKDKHEMFNFWGNDSGARTKSMEALRASGNFIITFDGAVTDNIIRGAVNGKAIKSEFNGEWSANGKTNQFSTKIGSSTEDDILAKRFLEGLKAANSYNGDERNLYIYYTPEGANGQVLSLVFHVVK